MFVSTQSLDKKCCNSCVVAIVSGGCGGHGDGGGDVRVWTELMYYQRFQTRHSA